MKIQTRHNLAKQPNFKTGKKQHFPQILHGNDGACASCPGASSVPAPPTVLAGTATVLLGGIAGWVAMRSDVSFTDVTSESEWETKMTAGTLIVRLNGCRVKGDKPDSTTQTRKRGACSTEEIIKRNQVWNIEDVGNDDDYSMHDMYEHLRKYSNCYKWGFITCDYRLYGFIPSSSNAGSLMPSVAHFVDDNIPQTSDDDALIKMNVTTQQAGLVKPVMLTFLPNLADLIN
jgi:hypothetical protein